MFELLTRILLWLLIAAIVWYVFIQFIPRAYLTWLGGLIVFTFVVLAFLSPASGTVAMVWGMISSIFFKPLGLVIFLLLMSLKEGTKKIAANLVVAALLMLILTSMPIVAYWLAGQAERSIVDTEALRANANQVANVRAIVVLGDPTGLLDPSFRSRVQVSNVEEGFNNSLASRLAYAGRLYATQATQGNDPLVVVGAGPQLQDRSDEETGQAVQTIGNLLEGAGVPNNRILIETEGYDLYTTIVSVREALVARGFQPGTDGIILIAPALSISRATSTFARLDVDVLPEPTDQFAFQLESGRLMASPLDLIPNVDALALTTRVVDEYLTSVYYFLRGWVVDPGSF
ncbi:MULTISPECIES: ElyC/SanA/YdcF family protein [unclassified Leptolyngbya]|uniref:YdcF family protein n=1 Tax=unclassified Leptolyngbya TaxID=2650499 RepID=UPI0016845C8A|nr:MULTISPECIES: ElyC/SanA/YdcF family protein [unclassified Leptolyngbya]MBD1910050.1 YdcF family protein [Leptolyngbya sp. FACHB-8]MBD2153067.1 YdcF family protein [Leptolyngbya sp. FACHB-16]